MFWAVFWRLQFSTDVVLRWRNFVRSYGSDGWWCYSAWGRLTLTDVIQCSKSRVAYISSGSYGTPCGRKSSVPNPHWLETSSIQQCVTCYTVINYVRTSNKCTSERRLEEFQSVIRQRAVVLLWRDVVVAFGLLSCSFDLQFVLLQKDRPIASLYVLCWSLSYRSDDDWWVLVGWWVIGIQLHRLKVYLMRYNNVADNIGLSSFV